MAFDYVPTASWWLTRDIPPRDNLLGEWLATTSRIVMAGPTGIGKTNFILALLMALIAGLNFLHWRAVRPARVLQIDGEMPRRLTKRWLDDARRRAAVSPEVLDNLIVLSREDYPDMPPLNSQEGQHFIDQFLEHIGPVDLIVFDNIQSLLAGNMRETEQWSAMLDWSRELTARHIGQLWVHHTNSEGRLYGDTTRDWQMEATILLEKPDPEPAGLAFNLRFEKHRERTPENAPDFAPCRIGLDGDRWVSERGDKHSSRKPRTDKQVTHALVLPAIDEALEKDPKYLLGHPKVTPDTPCATVKLCVRYFTDRYPDDHPKTVRNRFFLRSDFYPKLSISRTEIPAMCTGFDPRLAYAHAHVFREDPEKERSSGIAHARGSHALNRPCPVPLPSPPPGRGTGSGHPPIARTAEPPNQGEAPCSKIRSC